MKSKNQKAGLILSASLPLFLFVAGCTDKSEAPANDSTMRNQDARSVMTNADNSGLNVRDRDGPNLTPGDQGNSASDRIITQSVRKTLMSGTNDFSMTAKNVKIITANGKVTLRGPVNTAAEKMGIENIAKSVAGEGNVDDQLE